MKAYPLIYSRTKLCDYVSGFLVRPSDLNYMVATQYVSVALNEIKYSDGLRHTVFAVGDYVIYGGTACITSALISRILKDRKITDFDYNYKEFCSDQAGRPITFFIGFAIKKSTIEDTTLIPNVDLYETYKIYLKYLEKQWLNSTTKTCILNGDDAIELGVTKYSEKFIPDTIENQGISILKNYDEYSYQDVINYYYHELVAKSDSDSSFISNILPEMLNDSFIFKNTSFFDISVDDYMNSLYKTENVSMGTKVDYFESDDAPKVYKSSSEYNRGVSQPNTTLHQPVKNNNVPTVYHSGAQYRREQEDLERKKSFPTSWKTILAIAIALLVGIILLVAHRVSIKEKTRFYPKSESSTQKQQNESMINNLKTEVIQIIKSMDNL